MVEICTNVHLLPYNTAHNFIGAFEIRFRILVYEQLKTRETLTLTPNPNGKLFESDYWHASRRTFVHISTMI